MLETMSVVNRLVVGDDVVLKVTGIVVGVLMLVWGLVEVSQLGDAMNGEVVSFVVSVMSLTSEVLSLVLSVRVMGGDAISVTSEHLIIVGWSR